MYINTLNTFVSCFPRKYWKVGVKKLLFLGSSCIYPKMAPQPLTEDALLTGPLEPTNEPYAIAKIAGIKLCDAYRDQYGADFISVMPPGRLPSIWIDMCTLQFAFEF
mgnify:CR=1 FL=1